MRHNVRVRFFWDTVYIKTSMTSRLDVSSCPTISESLINLSTFKYAVSWSLVICLCVTRVQRNERRVFEMMSIHSRSCDSVMTSGGANRMISPCVGLAICPLSRKRKHTSHASYSAQYNGPALFSWNYLSGFLGMNRPYYVLGQLSFLPSTGPKGKDYSGLRCKVLVWPTGAVGVRKRRRQVVTRIQESEVRNMDSLDNRRSYQRILMKFYGELGCGLETNWLHFGDDPHHYPDPGVCSGSLFRSGKNWRSAEICALWVLLVMYATFVRNEVISK